MMGRELSMDFDLNNMPASEAQRLHNLLNESKFFEIPTVHELQANPDEYQYDLSVVAGNSIHTVHATESSMPPSIQPLLEELTEMAKAAAS